MSQQPTDPSDQPSVDETVDNDDQDSEPTMTAPADARPDGTVADSPDDERTGVDVPDAGGS